MRIPESSVERSLTLGKLEKGPELVELKRKERPDTYSVKYSQLMQYEALERILQQ